MTADSQQLRREIRAQRLQLTDQEVITWSATIADKLAAARSVQRAKHVAIYMADFGEVNCAVFTEHMFNRGKQVFVPILRKNRLLFAPLEPDSVLRKNHYGIAEPVYSDSLLLGPAQLDVVITPLVAFDAQLNRLGMGGGYYDRSFAFKKRRQHWHRPRMIGVAYSFQLVEQLSAQAWDVPLNAVITEKESYGSY